MFQGKLCAAVEKVCYKKLNASAGFAQLIDGTNVDELTFSMFSDGAHCSALNFSEKKGIVATFCASSNFASPDSW
jgi:hypothetical protein